MTFFLKILIGTKVFSFVWSSCYKVYRKMNNYKQMLFGEMGHK